MECNKKNEKKNRYENLYAGSVGRTPFRSFLTLMGVWKGSLLQQIWIHLAVFLFLYYTVRIVYDHGLMNEGNEKWKQSFEMFVIYCGR